MRFDLHVHTKASLDSWVPARKLGFLAKRKGLAGVAVTDHSSISSWGDAADGAKGSGVMIIRGEEVAVKPAGKTIGEIIGLFMSERVDGKGKGALEVVDELRAQDAIVVLPHPFDPLRNIFSEPELERIAGRADAVEVINARALFHSYNERAKKFAEKFGLSETGGSDSHASWEVGSAYTEADADDEEGLRKALKKGLTRGGGRRNPYLFTRAVAVTAKLKNRIAGRRKP